MRKLMILAVMIVGFAINGNPRAVEKQESRSLNVLELSTIQKQTKELNSFLALTKEERAAYINKYRAEIKRKNSIKKAWKGRTNDFLLALGLSESGNNSKVYNKYGYLGRWQFGKSALVTTGYGHVTFDKFKKDPSIFDEQDQYDAMIKFTKINRKTLSKHIGKYVGKTINGIVITESGILAGAHIGGAGGMMKYLDSGGEYNPSDAFNTSIENYLEKFSGYEVNLT